MKLRSITTEQLRILSAAAEGRLSFSMDRFRYEIEGDDPPDRRERERLQKRGLMSRPSENTEILTERGREALESAPVEDDPPKPVQTDLIEAMERIGGEG